MAGICVWAAIGGWTGAIAGGLVTAFAWRTLRRADEKESRQRRQRLVADLPIAVELLAACLTGGASWKESAEAVASALGGPLGEEFAAVSAQLNLGADPSDAWLQLAATPELAPLGRAAARASQSGAALAPTLARLARDQRATARHAADTRARSAGIQAVAPLGLCFLPAFILLGIVPVIAGIAQTIALP